MKILGKKLRSAFLILQAAAIVIAFSGVKTPSQTDNEVRQAIALFEQGQNVHEKGNLDEAIRLYTKALELLPEFPEAELQRGTAYFSQKKFDDAESSFRRAVELRNEWSLAYAKLGEVLVRKQALSAESGDKKAADQAYTDATSTLTKAIELDRENASAYAALAELKLRSSVSADSLRELLESIKSLTDGKSNQISALWSARASLENRLGDRTAAKTSSDRALKIDPENVLSLSISADIALLEKDVEKADGYVRRLEKVSPGTSDAVSLRARVLYSQGKKAESLALLESIKQPNESIKELIAQAKDGDIADLAGLEAKILRTPNDVNALAKLCEGYRVGNPAKAIDYCRRASLLEPNEIAHAVGFGAALVQARMYVEAVGLLRKLLVIAPEHATIRANLGTALFQLKRYPEAKIEFQWLSERQPVSSAAFYFLGITHDQLGEYFDALASYKQFLKIADPEKEKLEIEKVNLRLPAIEKQIKSGKGKKAG